MKMRNEEEGRRRVTPTFFFLRGVPNDRTRTRGFAYFYPSGSVFPGEDPEAFGYSLPVCPEAFGIRYLLVTTNIIQVISIMSRGKIGFIKIVINTVHYGDNTIFCLRSGEKIDGES